MWVFVITAFVCIRKDNGHSFNHFCARFNVCENNLPGKFAVLGKIR